MQVIPSKNRMNLTFKPLIFALFLFFLTSISNGQTILSPKEKIIVPVSTIIKLDTLSIYPNSFQIVQADLSQYYINHITATLYLNDTSLIGTPLHCKYLVFDTDFSKVFNHKSTELISKKGNLYKPEITNLNSSIFGSTNNESALVSNGSITRGFSVGNNQDFVLNSALNLQLSGFLAPDIEIKANITDKNIPIQPEGNTRTIQEFDKIFITLNYKNKWMLHAGDLDLAKPESYFLVLNKKIVGMELSFKNDFHSQYTWQNKTGGGISKGRFAKQKLEVINGRQGPYKLTGNQTITNIVILSGSERVYIDNKLMIRGLDNDYVIDYNTGEITFTSRILITSEKEIHVEYEFSDLSYSRYTLYTFNQIKSTKDPKWTITCNFFQEQDLRNSSIQPELTDSMKLFLSSLEDTDQPFYPGIDTSSYYPGEIRYAAKDSVVDEILYHIYYYSNDQTLTLYRLNMTWMGDHKGDYILTSSGTNGRVFQWVAPINNVKQGNYEPVIELKTPILKQIGTLGFNYDLSKSFFITSEFSFSNYDQNIFSNLDDQNNIGFAYTLNLNYNKTFLNKDTPKTPWSLLTKLGYEFINRNFKPIESFRNVEFNKDYNLGNQLISAHHETMVSFVSKLSHQKYGETNYFLNYYSIQNYINSLRNQITTNTKIGSFLFTSNSSLLFSDDTLNTTQYLRTLNQLSRTFKRVELGIYERFERNMFWNKTSQQIMDNSFRYNEIYLYFKNNDSLQFHYLILFKNIVSDQSKKNSIQRDQVAYEGQASFDFKAFKNQIFKGTTTYRRSYQNDTSGGLYAEDFFIGSLEYTGRFLNNAIQLNTYYEAGSGLEQKKIFTYIKVATGQGTHVWNDYNNNQMEELNEFEIAVFQNEANYIKIWIISNEYIYSYNNTFMQTIQLKPALLWNKSRGILKFISRFNNSTLIRISQKNTKENIIQALNPFIINSYDTTIIHSNILINNTFTFNQNQKFGIDYNYKFIQNKNFLYYGPENKQQESQEIIFRLKINTNMIYKLSFQKGNKLSSSTFFESNNFNLHMYGIRWESDLQFLSKWSINLNYQYKTKKNLSGFEKMNGNEVEMVINYRMPKKGTLSAKSKFAYFSSDQQLDGSLGYEMLEGLGLGKNFTWTFLYQMQVTEFLLIDFQYNGRITEKSRAIHNGTLEVKVIF